jgi:hypothetical protein
MRVLVGARLFTGDAMLEGHGIVTEDDRIADLVPDPLPAWWCPPATALRLRSLWPADFQTRRASDHSRRHWMTGSAG